MRRPFRSCLVWGAVLNIFSLSSAGFAETLRVEQAKPSLEITVRVYNYARVPSGTLARAQKEATRIFRQIGVKLAWSPCPLSAAERQGNPACRGRMGPTDLQLRILPRSMAERSGLPSRTFGFAVLSKKGEFGSLTNVFYHRVKELSQRQYGWSLILGHLMAHEMGHLLLGIGSHSDRGIMRVPWDPKQLDRAAMGNLLFTPAQAERIRAQVQDRIRAQQGATSGGV